MMKRSTHIELAIAAVINDSNIDTMNKIEVLKTLIEARDFEFYKEREDAKE